MDEQKKQWFVVHAFSGYEGYVMREIKARAEHNHLEELIGEERAAEGRKKRAKAASHPRDPATVKKILTTKKKTGVYDSPTHGMRGKQHRAETKVKQSTKAQVRQDLKRRLGLGRNDSIPRDVLEAEYQQLKL